MKGKLILLLILTFTAISRFFLVDKIPPLLSSSVVSLRLLSAAATITSTALIFFLVERYFQNTKIALLTAWVFCILPWTFEQGRINSAPNLALVLILCTLLLAQKFFSKFKYTFLLFIPVLIFISYPQFWLFKFNEFEFSIHSLITNLYILTSFDFLFFRNVTFWWGGVREFGVMFLSFLPFHLIGIYQLVTNKEKKLLFIFGLITFIAALSPFFPESREFYFATPLISITVALGIYHFSIWKSIMIKSMIGLLFLLMIYEYMQFMHFYFVHYPQQIKSNFSQIHEAF